jgi:hypothetical protein
MDLELTDVFFRLEARFHLVRSFHFSHSIASQTRTFSELIQALSSPFATKLHMLPGRWLGHLDWVHGSHRKQGMWELWTSSSIAITLKIMLVLLHYLFFISADSLKFVPSCNEC